MQSVIREFIIPISSYSFIQTENYSKNENLINFHPVYKAGMTVPFCQQVVVYLNIHLKKAITISVQNYFNFC